MYYLITCQFYSFSHNNLDLGHNWTKEVSPDNLWDGDILLYFVYLNTDLRTMVHLKWLVEIC